MMMFLLNVIVNIRISYHLILAFPADIGKAGFAIPWEPPTLTCWRSR